MKADLDVMALSANEAVRKMNDWGARRRPFLFMSDAWANRCVILSPLKAQELGLFWDLEGQGNLGVQRSPPPKTTCFRVNPVEFGIYHQAFDKIRNEQSAGNTWLANLTFPSEIKTNLSLASMVRRARAPFRVYLQGHFAVFSPERFVRIDRNGIISAFPMKGTRPAGGVEGRVGAEMAIMEDEKERAEHTTIVDLIRNDLGMVAERVEVPRFRFITEVEARGRKLLQVSSEVKGVLGRGWRGGLGELLMGLLPAGSVTGAPKARTCEILREVEGYERGWYTGVFGFFDGEGVDSCVMIRFAEVAGAAREAGAGATGATERQGRMIYKSGGGITIYSDVAREYQELKDKVYVPFAT